MGRYARTARTQPREPVAPRAGLVAAIHRRSQPPPAACSPPVPRLLSARERAGCTDSALASRRTGPFLLRRRPRPMRVISKACRTEVAGGDPQNLGSRKDAPAVAWSDRARPVCDQGPSPLESETESPSSTIARLGFGQARGRQCGAVRDRPAQPVENKMPAASCGRGDEPHAGPAHGRSDRPHFELGSAGERGGYGSTTASPRSNEPDMSASASRSLAPTETGQTAFSTALSEVARTAGDRATLRAYHSGADVLRSVERAAHEI